MISKDENELGNEAPRSRDYGVSTAGCEGSAAELRGIEPKETKV